MRALVLLVPLLLAWSVDAAAQAPSDARDARRLFESGEAALRDGRFESALADFRASYELDRAPAALRRAGESADLLRRDEEALATFEAYLRGGPEDLHVRTIEARVAILREVIAQRARARARSLEDACAEHGDAAALGSPDAATASLDPAAIAWTAADRHAAVRGSTAPPGSTAPEPAALALAIGGAVVLAGGITMVVVGETDRARVESAPAGTPWSSLADAAWRAPVLDGIGITALVLGGIATASGIAWSIAGPRDVELVAWAGGAGARGSF